MADENDDEDDLIDEEDEPWHVVPPRDLKRHSISATCWCKPQYVEEGHLIVHNSLEDERSSCYIH